MVEPLTPSRRIRIPPPHARLIHVDKLDYSQGREPSLDTVTVPLPQEHDANNKSVTGARKVHAQPANKQQPATAAGRGHYSITVTTPAIASAHSPQRHADTNDLARPRNPKKSSDVGGGRSRRADPLPSTPSLRRRRRTARKETAFDFGANTMMLDGDVSPTALAISPG